MSPRSMSLARKWIIVLLICTGTLCVTCTSSIYTATYTQLNTEFDINPLVSTVGLSTFVLGIGLGPLLTGPLSENYGRRTIYLVSWSLFIIWTIPSAVAKNIETIIIARFFNGFAGGTFLSVAGGTVGDVFSRSEIQTPMAFVSLTPLVGPSLGPLLGGFINYYVHWRWTYYIMIIWSVVLWLAIVFFAPETYHSIILRDKERSCKQSNEDQYQAPVEATYNMNLWQIGLTFSGIITGMIIAAAGSPIWCRIRQHLVEKHEKETGDGEPEYRLPPAILGGVLIPVGLFWFGWTADSRIHWILPIMGSAVFGCGMSLVFTGVFTFLVDAYPQYAASALAANGCARCSFAAAFPLFGNQMYEKLGHQWATSLLAFLTVVMMPFPWLFFKYGKVLRKRSRFAVET
ncbi:hypothetical protein ASPWEDRAFT_53430 [Aspergillus wentii DTO 134E9]|uniref:Major facilitator superfamily (MFS) profile domain-containing protein n=1 Tax=Aspergillus wentii DTO 134E9 TaxID=1073089 RepID=A0A1L9RF70_ASPWE|nr:uncharacterized protein ASPWEDRAFT_53430 [Aspergillus wentii DTO 134E9]OJJ33513.1 hypothetical protein ASPWEDRAFT_53430 [Aspergillus wentii DTO 134E9]